MLFWESDNIVRRNSFQHKIFPILKDVCCTKKKKKRMKNKKNKKSKNEQTHSFNSFRRNAHIYTHSSIASDNADPQFVVVVRRIKDCITFPIHLMVLCLFYVSVNIKFSITST